MTDATAAALAAGFLAGAAAGALYFGGLWLTVSRAPRSGRPRLLLGTSLLVRLPPLIFVFFLLARWNWTAAAAGMAGLLTARRAWLAAMGRQRWT